MAANCLETLRSTFYAAMKDVERFTQHAGGLKLRKYQIEVAEAIIKSVIKQQGLSFVVMFPRQSGKNELQAQIETYLLRLFMNRPVEIVKISPTWKPQSQNAMRRLEGTLKKNVLCHAQWQKENGYIYRLGQARVTFLSGAPESNIVGATASTLLEVDEAQDVKVDKFDKDVAPMAASTNATRVFWGTAWTSQTLLARELRAAREAEKDDGERRVFVLSAEDVAAEVPAYGKFVAEQVRRFGRAHPMVKTQYYSEEIDGEAGMFPPPLQALMFGSHPHRLHPEPGKLYALLLDVAGEEGPGSSADSAQSKRDATALTVVEVDLSTLTDELLRGPTYRVVERRLWVGIQHNLLYGQIKALAETWRAVYLIVDATGIGAGLASFLGRALPGRVIPFVFSTKSKSELGWNFLTICESGRFKDWQGEDDARRDERWEFWRQLRACQMEVLPGPGSSLRWGVPDGTRDPQTGDLLHDDLVLSAALCAALDKQPWSAPGGTTLIVKAADPLQGMDREGF